MEPTDVFAGLAAVMIAVSTMTSVASIPTPSLASLVASAGEDFSYFRSREAWTKITEGLASEVAPFSLDAPDDAAAPTGSSR